jgi:hypothetical protein
VNGPGTNLKGIFATLGIMFGAGCKCEEHAAQMDAWGAAECRNHITEIVEWLRTGVDSFGWSERLVAAKNALTTGLAFQVNWLDPFPDIVEKAISMSEGETVDYGRGCQCPAKGFCTRYGRDMSNREVQICRGVNITDTARQTYVDSWSPKIVKPSVSDPTPSRPLPPNIGLKAPTQSQQCQHFGALLRVEQVPSCCGGASKSVPIHHCFQFHEECQTGPSVSGIRVCHGCPARQTVSEPESPAPVRLKWAYGITTVLERLDDGTLEKTIDSLRMAGFDQPRLFVDGVYDIAPFARFGLEITNHWPRLRAVGNWITALWNLYLREPHADRYAIFQDDIEAADNLRGFLDASPYPANAYLNLITYPVNETNANGKPGWVETTQRGQGGQGLVFNRDAVKALLTSPHLANKPTINLPNNPSWRNLDGMVVTAMNQSGFREFCHLPSLIRHTGTTSTLGNGPQPEATSFRKQITQG